MPDNHLCERLILAYRYIMYYLGHHFPKENFFLWYFKVFRYALYEKTTKL